METAVFVLPVLVYNCMAKLTRL